MSIQVQKGPSRRVGNSLKLIIVSIRALARAGIMHIADDRDPKQSARNLLAENHTLKPNQ
jgi:hypothetical protein